jgi:hypothetical protein
MIMNLLPLSPVLAAGDASPLRKVTADAMSSASLRSASRSLSGASAKLRPPIQYPVRLRIAIRQLRDSFTLPA